ncbi:MAG: nuclear transport factor 2 family protein [Caulobacteraceae bacterium]|nr:nuclear transport factor 2 family protein [Caulobacter sp.]RYF93466.1 MAG: nuclear transport factor 2 family protein [Caulobacteraceae bacterium]
MSKTDPESLVRDCFQAWADSDRDWLEDLLADDFLFTSPLDNRLDRETYFRHCWPNGSMIVGFDIKHLAVVGNCVFVTYEGQNTGGKVFRNTELHHIRDGKIAAVEVYFGWNVPHDASRGGFLGHG